MKTASSARRNRPRQRGGEEPAARLRRLAENLGKLGGTDFRATDVKVVLSEAWFLPASAINALRRDAVEQLIAARAAARAPGCRARCR
jgi:hypothetical protein